jgi:hypothetical protein
MGFGELAGLSAAAVHAAGYVAYYRRVRDGTVRPNATSVSLWLFGNIVSLWGYALVTHDWYKLGVPITCTAGMCIIAVQTFWRYGLAGVDRADVVVAGLDVSIIATWFFSRSVPLTYAALLIDTLLSFIPIWRSTFAEPGREHATPWVIWSVAYLLMLVTAVVRWEGMMPVLLPAVYIFCHATIAALAVRARGEAATPC